MRKLTVLLLTLAMFLLLVPAASAAIHPIVCSGKAQANGLVANPGRSDDIGNPPGITPDGNSPFGFHEDIKKAADGNPTGPNAFGLSENQFAPLIKSGFTGPQWDKPNCINPP